ncbi:MAG: hypothetical protein V2A74_06050 [bacterium]
MAVTKKKDPATTLSVEFIGSLSVDDRGNVDGLARITDGSTSTIVGVSGKARYLVTGTDGKRVKTNHHITMRSRKLASPPAAGVRGSFNLFADKKVEAKDELSLPESGFDVRGSVKLGKINAKLDAHILDQELAVGWITSPDLHVKNKKWNVFEGSAVLHTLSGGVETTSTAPKARLSVTASPARVVGKSDSGPEPRVKPGQISANAKVGSVKGNTHGLNTEDTPTTNPLVLNEAFDITKLSFTTPAARTSLGYPKK